MKLNKQSMNSKNKAFMQGMRDEIEKNAEEESSPAMKQLSNAGNPFTRYTKDGGFDTLALGALTYSMTPFASPMTAGVINTAIEPYTAGNSIEIQEPGYKIPRMN